MSNKSLFTNRTSNPVSPTPVADTVNAAGGDAYASEPKQALAQIAATNCFNGTYYASASDNLNLAREAALKLKNDPTFVAKVAMYSRTKGYMKDMPAFLMVMLADSNRELFNKLFSHVIDNGKMLRNFVQIARSGATGRKFNMSARGLRKTITSWFHNRDARQLFKDSIGNDPSMKDMLRMCRPKPISEEQEALFGYFLGKDIEVDRLPEIVRQYENYKRTKKGVVPNVDFRQLDSLGLGTVEWTEIARNASWQMTRMNLNTFARHGVFNNKEVSKIVAARLNDPEQVLKSKVFPYQLMMAYKATESNNEVPGEIREALQDAMEIAINNVPSIDGQVYVCVDTSGSMGSPITGDRGLGSRANSSVSCVDVAALVASTIVRRNPNAKVLTFQSTAQYVPLNPRDTVITNTSKLAKAGGGTNCSAGLATLNKDKAMGDAVIYVSDYESWVDSSRDTGYGFGTGMLSEWNTFHARNPKAKLVCIDLTPSDCSQVKEHNDILQVGGFSDTVFDVVRSFINHGTEKNHWVDEIESVQLPD